MPYMYFIYKPYSHIIIKRETPLENIIFYLYSFSDINDLEFLFENKLNNHYERCGICDLCKKYINYIKRYKPKNEISDEEKEAFINN